MKYRIGSVIKEIRKEKNISIKQLAIETNISESSLYSIELERRTPVFETIEIIAKALGYPVILLIMKAIKEDKTSEAYTQIVERIHTT